MENTITSEELKTWAELVVKYQMGDLAPTFSRAANTIQKLQSDNKALLEACEAFDEADASDDGTGEAIGRVVSAKVLIKKAIEQAKEGGVMWATGF